MAFKADKRRQQGFSLVETLIAAVIAAGVVAAAAQSISGSVKLTNAAAERTALLEQSQTIIARLRAGMNDKEALADVSGWTIERAPLEIEGAETPPPLQRVVLIHIEDNRFNIELLLEPPRSP